MMSEPVQTAIPPRAPRHPVKGLGFLASVDGEAALYALRVVNVSAGGICGDGGRTLKVGSRVRIHVQAANWTFVAVSAVVAWREGGRVGFQVEASGDTWRDFVALLAALQLRTGRR